ncbi:Ig-like domain-containing protein [Candidatus Desantisbacteria bacterium]|nr:Ig-like domain-containing protein [Candidatus Desantisbacteria bacterium]
MKIKNPLIVLILLFLHSTIFARAGSNLGQYGTNYKPCELKGQVVDENESPVNDAKVYTIAGHNTRTDINGNYSFYLDAPGFYTIFAKSDLKKIYKSTEVKYGTTTVLNLSFSDQDNIPPNIISVIPANGSKDIAVNTEISAVFSETMDTSTINASTLLFKGVFLLFPGKVSLWKFF